VTAQAGLDMSGAGVARALDWFARPSVFAITVIAYYAVASAIRTLVLS